MPTQNLSRIRRSNLLIILREFTDSERAAGHSAVGVMGRLAEKLQIKGSALSQIAATEDARSFRNIGDNLAQQIERLSDKEPGWMDEYHGNVDDPAELAFLENARAAWRATNAAGRRALMKLAKNGFVDEAQLK